MDFINIWNLKIKPLYPKAELHVFSINSKKNTGYKKNNIFVAESGIKNKKDIDMLVANNINAFLIGESLMKGDFS